MFDFVLKVEVEEEELQPKEVEKEVVSEVKVPQVKAMYSYTGDKGLKFEKGEVGERKMGGGGGGGGGGERETVDMYRSVEKEGV